jgi:hypothetical protein
LYAYRLFGQRNLGQKISLDALHKKPRSHSDIELWSERQETSDAELPERYSHRFRRPRFLAREKRDVPVAEVAEAAGFDCAGAYAPHVVGIPVIPITGIIF